MEQVSVLRGFPISTPTLTQDSIDRTRPAGQYSILMDMPGDKWDRLLTEFADPYCEQTHTYRALPFGEHRARRLVVELSGRIVAMALVLVFKVPVLNRGMAQVKFGPLWRRKGEADDPAHLRLAIAALVEQFAKREKLSLTIIPPPDPRFASLFTEELMAHGFSRQDVKGEEHYLVDLTPTAAELRASLSQTWRHKLKTAEKAGLTMREETTPETLAAFADLFRETEARKNYANPMWPSYLKMMQKTLGGPVTPSIVLVEHQGKAVAGAVIAHIGETVYYLFGATNDAGVKLQAGYAMHWWIIGWLQEKNARWYDLGCTVGNAGLHQFKKGLVGKRGTIADLPGEFTLVRDPASALLAKAGISAKTLLGRVKRAVSTRMRSKSPQGQPHSG